jgi:thiol-disulfide isomerase/thioredoxin
MKKSLFLLSVFILISCSKPETKKTTLHTGLWRAVIQTQGEELPFGLVIESDADTFYTVFAINGQEKLRLDKAVRQGDSLKIPMEIFESELVAKIEDSVLIGRFTRYNVGVFAYSLPFRARLGDKDRFKVTSAPTNNTVSGKWETSFLSEKDTSQAVGVFEQQGRQLTGSFLTPTGDYRYLSGNVAGDSLFLSTFDGSHLYLFKAKIKGDTIAGGFWSGKSGYKKWLAVRNNKAALPDANALTFLRKGYDKISFRFPDADGKMVSLADERFKGKVVILQIMGSWCPNCMDETNFLAPWYKKNKAEGIEIIGLAFEKKNDLAFAAPKLKKILLAGKNENASTAEALPMLNKVMGYPTTIFIDRQGKVRRIHTGFSGPGTGKFYEEFMEDFENFVAKLAVEKQ